MSLTTAFEEVTDRGDRNALITIYQKSLGINLSKEAQTSVPGGDIFPLWAVHAVVGILSGTACLVFFVSAYWLTSTVR